MTRVLDRLIEAYRGDRQDQPRDVTHRRSIESDIDVGIALFESAKNEVRRWQEDVSDWDSPQTIAQARSYDALYRKLNDTLEKLDGEAAGLEAVDPRSAPENIKRLRTALRELAGIVCFDLDRVMAADRAFRDGTPTRTTAEVRDGLRRRMGE